MGVLQKLSEKFAVQTAVYWGNPVNDGYGQYTYDEPIEISVRWDEKQELVKYDKGNERMCKAKAIVTGDYFKGMLALTTLDTLNGEYSDISDPKEIDGVFEIISYEKIPMVLKDDDFFRTIYIGSKNV